MNYSKFRRIFSVLCVLSLFNVEAKSVRMANWNDHKRTDSSGRNIPLRVCPSDIIAARMFGCLHIPVGESRDISEYNTRVYDQGSDDFAPVPEKTSYKISFRKLLAIKEAAVLPILSAVQRRRVVLVDLQYPYGKKKVYMNGSLLAVAAQCVAAGHDVEILDLNIDELEGLRAKEILSKAQVIGVSVVGSPYFPPTAAFCRFAAERYPHAKVVLGGQVIKHLDDSEFRRIFGKLAFRDADSEPILGTLPSVYEVPFQPVWERMGDERLRKYLEHEFALFLSQGCAFNCHFCAADKNRKEQHRNLAVFSSDLMFLFKKAQQFGLTKLECYASALDFFQNPQKVASYMQATALLSQGFGIEFKMRALCCMSTFLKASRTIPDFPELVRHSGLWCVGFGVDGPNEEVWKQQNKLQNDAQDIVDCLNLSEQIGIRAEVLMIMGYPSNTSAELAATVRDCYRYTRRWPNVVLRPYLAKTLLPGNLGWETQPGNIERLIANPQEFYNLDICSLGSALTHPRRLQRWLANASYLSVIAGLAPFGRCATSPLLPQGSRGLVGKLARVINRHMPFDR